MPELTRNPVPRAVLAFAAVLLPALLASGCSSSGSGTSTSAPAAASSTPVASTPAPSSAAATPSVPSPSTPPAGTLSGKWSGTYTGAFTGTFALTWTQTSELLKGTIDLSTSGTLPLTGKVQGNAITFGTVGSQAVTYVGTVSGDTMSGTYVIGASQQGSWTAHRTS